MRTSGSLINAAYLLEGLAFGGLALLGAGFTITMALEALGCWEIEKEISKWQDSIRQNALDDSAKMTSHYKFSLLEPTAQCAEINKICLKSLGLTLVAASAALYYPYRVLPILRNLE